MTESQNLYQQINTQKRALKNFNPKLFSVPNFITNNLKHSFFEWQTNAFENFLYYQNPKAKLLKNPTHLMFNMATGTGKTLIMAACILYYYKQGYRHFLFFVNQNNIVDKTENNFVNPLHNKYLFKEKIVIDDKTVDIKTVDTFSDNPQTIEIKFTTIQKLYNDIHIEKENQTTLEDLHNKDIVMLADEAHHLNADTKKVKTQERLFATELKENASKEEVEKKGWEHTVLELILNKNEKKENNKNVLLEFTATIPAVKSIQDKYKDKTIYKFDLKDFLQKGYTKEINLVSSTLDKKSRVLLALLFAWYREKIALKYNIANFKSVMLFRSKTIAESKNDYDFFINFIEELEKDDFKFLSDIHSRIKNGKTIHEQSQSRIEQILKFINTHLIRYSEITTWIKINYSDKNTIITNSKENAKTKEFTDEKTEKLLNNLEDKDNHIRAIFTVNRLTEGWDVLNLFDIVRMAEKNSFQNAGGGNKKTPEATIQERQLIGRGVRYFPFEYEEKIKNKRKFDDDINHELRLLEEFYYFTYDEDSKYISHLKIELKKEGYFSDEKTLKTFALKEEFKKTDFFKHTKIWYNKQEKNLHKQKKTLDKLSRDFSTKYILKGLQVNEQEVDFDNKDDKQKIDIQSRYQTITKKVRDIEKHIFLKAVNIKAKQDNSFFQFSRLREYLYIQSIDELQTKFLKDFNLSIVVDNQTSYDDITNKDKLDWVLHFFNELQNELESNTSDKVGTPFKYSTSFNKLFGEPKTKVIKQDDDSARISRELKKADWFILDSFVGTDEEKGLVEFVKQNIGNLTSKYKNVYLLRNEEIYKIYDFKTGQGFCPDFLLFLKSKEKKTVYYQIFIEPKMEDRFKPDQWKEEFLKEIKEKYGPNSDFLFAENKKYYLIGLPFYNKTNQELFQNFEKKFQKYLYK